MLRLLKIEWNKIYYYKTARIFTILYFLLLSIIGGSFFLIFKFILKDRLGFSIDISQTGFFDFPVIWQNMSYLLIFGKIFLAVIIITNITNEYSNKTIKQNLIDGLSKKEFLTSKLLSNFLLGLISTLFVFVICFILGNIYSKSESSFYHGLEYVGGYLLNISFFFVFCTFISILVRKSAFALLLIFIWWVFEWILIFTEVYLRGFTSSSQQLTEKPLLITEYLPLSSASSVLQFSDAKIQGFVMGGSIFSYTPLDWKFVVATLVYIIIFIFFSYKLLKKRDL
ncbi:ABC transporter permease [Moheibacter sediminis]|uniref:ABC-type transport system involved in multi-copper enzyme maturation, permease component n=1 Tax=Moheibacter sediminis TaxID=1434700 RepID=A0A1W1ZPL9_9FLAO|nr:ABC transporter permease subunit [Moheibacter sediminis]SMC50495.1 hypothetical protein SAMN06296427_103141 [Moheibacter sediminis]